MPDIMRHGKKPLDSGANLYHITLGLGLRLRVAPPYFAICVRLTRQVVTVSWQQRPWQRYAHYWVSFCLFVCLFDCVLIPLAYCGEIKIVINTETGPWHALPPVPHTLLVTPVPVSRHRPAIARPPPRFGCIHPTSSVRADRFPNVSRGVDPTSGCPG